VVIFEQTVAGLMSRAPSADRRSRSSGADSQGHPVSIIRPDMMIDEDGHVASAGEISLWLAQRVWALGKLVGRGNPTGDHFERAEPIACRSVSRV
jgi:hypothetical protein